MIFDVAVVGGGINGAGVAREAAYRGYTTLLLEQHDYAQATSSQSTKLIHGGIRYLETAQFHLVWESLHERRTLLRIAPHLVHPLELVIPIFAGSVRPPWMVRLGALLYDVLAGRKNLGHSRGVSREELQAIPYLRQEGLLGAVAYFDAQTLDSRLTLETVLSAREAGATVLNYHPVRQVRLENSAYVLEAIDRRTGGGVQFRARSVVNATGPWAPFFERATMAHPTRPIAYDRGIHFVIPSLGIKTGLCLMASDRRLVFVLPWRERFTLIGTTEKLFQGSDFSHIPPSEEEIGYLLDTFNEFFPSRALKREEVLHIYSGVRSLIAPGRGSISGASRESEVALFSDAPGMAWAIVYGGKLTSYRSYAVRIVNKLAGHIGVPAEARHQDTAATPLYGAAILAGAPDGAGEPSSSGPDAAQLALWRKRYGSRWPELAARIRQSPALQDVLVPSHGFTRADLEYMVDVEQAWRLEDLTLRRTKMIYDMTREESEHLRGALREVVLHRGWKWEETGGS